MSDRGYELPAPRAVPFRREAWRDGGQLYQTAPWIEAMSSRIGDHPFVLTENASNGHAQLLAFYQEDLEGYEAYNLAALTVRVPPVFPMDNETEAKLVQLRRDRALITESSLFPNVIAAVPGYGSPLVTHGLAADKLVHRLLDNLIETAASMNAAACGLLYMPDVPALKPVFAELSFSRIRLTQRATLHLPEGGLEGYLLKTGPSTRRKKLRKEIRLLTAAGVTTRPFQGSSDWQLLIDLRIAHLAGLGHQPDREAEECRLVALRTHFQDLRLLVVEKHGTPVAATLYIVQDRVAYVVMLAIDHQVAPPYTLFEASYYALIRALDGLADTIDLGIGHLEPKRRRGATLQKLDAWIRPLQAGAVDTVRRIVEVRGGELGQGELTPESRTIRSATSNFIGVEK